jgi:chromosome segregation ATPase
VSESAKQLATVAADSKQIRASVRQLHSALCDARKALSDSRAEFAAGNATLGDGFSKGLAALAVQLREQQTEAAARAKEQGQNAQEALSLLRALSSEQRALKAEVAAIRADTAELGALKDSVAEVNKGVQGMRGELANSARPASSKWLSS